MDELNIEILLNNVDISILKNADGICSLHLSNAFQSTLGKLCGVSVTSRFIIIRTESNTDADNSINVHRAITVCNMDGKRARNCSWSEVNGRGKQWIIL